MHLSLAQPYSSQLPDPVLCPADASLTLTLTDACLLACLGVPYINVRMNE